LCHNNFKENGVAGFVIDIYLQDIILLESKYRNINFFCQVKVSKFFIL